MNDPLVSVIIPCYNHEKFIQDSIQSVIDQNYENIELIVIDDGSKDSSVEKIKEMVGLCEKRFTRFEFRYRSNKGLSPTLNEAIEWCKGEFVSVHDSDDVLLAHKTKLQVAFLKQNKKCVAVFGGETLIDENSNFIKNRIKKENKYTFDQILMLEHDLPCSSQLIRLEILRKVGGYKDEVKIEDWYMWLRLAQEGEICYIPDILIKYRLHSNNTHKRTSFMHDSRMMILNDYKDHILFDKAKKRILWLNACEVGRLSKKESLKNMFKILKEYPSEILKYDFFRFFYWFFIRENH
ncbi:glycosyl transferase family 2 [Acinetobacter sp. LoGeW2-3]|uniref:glycosyltransferase family 2 protein n=1 Tax=Acinetobacter sp. LoGeW2-3 TaxID=1808001 RepID=UPI000C05A6E8|nr:glycosyltransferase [Acinetobacter sp. LoGeW2-3]ATO19197.1 glycosyl transferase family 2 [Acinetobacter sp. LoGeW2-3]